MAPPVFEGEGNQIKILRRYVEQVRRNNGIRLQWSANHVVAFKRFLARGQHSPDSVRAPGSEPQLRGLAETIGIPTALLNRDQWAAVRKRILSSLLYRLEEFRRDDRIILGDRLDVESNVRKVQRILSEAHVGGHVRSEDGGDDVEVATNSAVSVSGSVIDVDEDSDIDIGDCYADDELIPAFSEVTQDGVGDADGGNDAEDIEDISLASLLNLTADLSELRSKGLGGQEAVVVEAIDGLLHVNGMWEDLAEALERLMADGGGEGWWSCDDSHTHAHAHGDGDGDGDGDGHEVQAGEEEEQPRLVCNSRRRMPPRAMMALVMRDLHNRVEALNSATRDRWIRVSNAKNTHRWKQAVELFKEGEAEEKEGKRGG
ncbi:hypothetical protein SLS53_008731 [Cytospora paraplurivora]|uniref:Uncharacterized protein n=1 Tax=Cytospora paraplurivora TaxID=2898453 RepID=A0AAN9TXB9_9PEZI